MNDQALLTKQNKSFPGNLTLKPSSLCLSLPVCLPQFCPSSNTPAPPNFMKPFGQKAHHLIFFYPLLCPILLRSPSVPLCLAVFTQTYTHTASRLHRYKCIQNHGRGSVSLMHTQTQTQHEVYWFVQYYALRLRCIFSPLFCFDRLMRNQSVLTPNCDSCRTTSHIMSLTEI